MEACLCKFTERETEGLYEDADIRVVAVGEVIPPAL